MDKQEYIDRLRDSPLFQASLDAVDDPVEKARVADRAIDFVSKVAESMAPVLQQVMDSPELAQLLRKELQKRSGRGADELPTK
jgi:hypothetical protein